MRRFALALSLICAGSLAAADVTDVIESEILPAFAALQERTADLAAAAETSCDRESLRPAYHAAFDAWIPASLYSFGPIEDLGLSLSFGFWPDPKDRVGKGLGRLIQAEDPVVDDPAAFAEVSAAAQGFHAMERLLYGEDPSAYECRLITAVATALARNSAALAMAWADHAPLLAAGASDRYRTPKEAQRAVYTALSTGLEFLHDERLGRPLGTFDRPRPKRAEARRSARSLRNVALSLTAMRDLAIAFTDIAIPNTEAAFAAAIERAETLDDPVFAGVADPGQRFRVEVLQREVLTIQREMANEIGAPMGLSAGFNALDGD